MASVLDMAACPGQFPIDAAVAKGMGTGSGHSGFLWPQRRHHLGCGGGVAEERRSGDGDVPGGGRLFFAWSCAGLILGYRGLGYWVLRFTCDGKDGSRLPELVVYLLPFIRAGSRLSASLRPILQAEP